MSLASWTVGARVFLFTAAAAGCAAPEEAEQAASRLDLAAPHRDAPAGAEPGATRFTSRIDLGEVGRLSLEVEIRSARQPAAVTSKYVWRFYDHTEVEYRCQTDATFRAGVAVVRLSDVATGALLEQYEVPFDGIISNFYPVARPTSRCTHSIPSPFAESSWISPTLRSIEYHDRRLDLELGGFATHTAGRRAGDLYIIDVHGLRADVPPLDLHVRYGEPTTFSAKFPVVRR